MRACPKCHIEKKSSEFAGLGACRSCNKVPCPICKEIFCPTGKKTHCSNKCNLLGNVKITENGCWEWQKCKMRGYGVIHISREKRKVLAHRLSYEIFVGKFDGDLFVCHKCDNPTCINPDHLFLGTAQENMKDCLEKKRLFPIRSVAHLRGDKVSKGGKLSPEQVKEIRTLRSQGVKRKEIAERYNITPEHVHGIVTGKAWSHI